MLGVVQVSCFFLKEALESIYSGECFQSEIIGSKQLSTAELVFLSWGRSLLEHMAWWTVFLVWIESQSHSSMMSLPPDLVVGPFLLGHESLGVTETCIDSDFR